MKKSNEFKKVCAIYYKVESSSEVRIQEHLGFEAILVVIMNFDGNGIEKYDALAAALEQNNSWSKNKKLELDIRHHESLLARSCIVEYPKLDHKSLQPHLRYVF